MESPCTISLVRLEFCPSLQRLMPSTWLFAWEGLVTLRWCENFKPYLWTVIIFWTNLKTSPCLIIRVSIICKANIVSSSFEDMTCVIRLFSCGYEDLVTDWKFLLLERECLNYFNVYWLSACLFSVLCWIGKLHMILSCS